MTWPAVKRAFDQEGFRKYVHDLVWMGWRPSRIVWHNTAAPSLKQWIEYAEKDRAKGLVPGITRINNLERFFQFDNHWPGCPHLLVANDAIWVMNPLTSPGVHSPSWNHISWGIEMAGDFNVEDDDSGEGLRVKNNTIFATAILCEALGLDPSQNTIFLHKQDLKTTHDCPGKDVAEDKFKMIQDVRDLMAGGEHDPHATATIIAGGEVPKPAIRWGDVLVSGLNFRTGPSASSPSQGEFKAGTKLMILGEANNSTTKWLKVLVNEKIGWVAGKFIKEEN